MPFISGIDRTQTHLLPETVEQYVPEDAPVRVIDAFVESLDVTKLGLKDEVAVPLAKGRPRYHPKTLLKLYLYAYLLRIRSSRRLEAECHRNLELIWLLGGLKPDFKTIAEFRRLNPKVFAGVFREFNLVCRRLNLFAGELIAIDGSKFKACNAFEKSFDEKQLKQLIEVVDAGILRYLEQLNKADSEAEGGSGSDPKGGTPEKIKIFKEKVASLEKEKRKCEDLLDRLRKSGRKDISATDSDSRRLHPGRGPGTIVGHNVQVAVDSKHGLIVAQDVVTEANDLHQLAPMAAAAVAFYENSASQVRVPKGSTPEGSTPEGSTPTDASNQPEGQPPVSNADVAASHTDQVLVVLADSGYCEADGLEACERLGVEPVVPGRQMRSQEQQKAGKKPSRIFPKSDFKYDPEKDIHVCPAKHEMPMVRNRKYRGKEYHHYRTNACTGCPFKKECTTARYRIIVRRSNEVFVERASERVRLREAIMRARSALVERIFGTCATWGANKFMMRGLEHVRGEFSLTAFSYNLRRCINIVGVPAILEALNAAK